MNDFKFFDDFFGTDFNNTFSDMLEAFKKEQTKGDENKKDSSYFHKVFDKYENGEHVEHVEKEVKDGKVIKDDGYIKETNKDCISLSGQGNASGLKYNDCPIDTCDNCDKCKCESEIAELNERIKKLRFENEFLQHRYDALEKDYEKKKNKWVNEYNRMSAKYQNIVNKVYHLLVAFKMEDKDDTGEK